MNGMPRGRLRSLLGFGLLLMIVACSSLVLGQAGNRKVFADSIVPLPQPKDDSAEMADGLVVNASSLAHKTDKMQILFAIGMSAENQKKLEKLVAEGRTVTPAELKQMEASGDAVKKLTSWLNENGFKVLPNAPTHSGVYAESTVTNIEKTLQVNMVRVTSNGLTYNAASDAPSLPPGVGEGVRAILGLQPFRQANRHSKKLPRVGPAKNATGLIPQTANAPPYLVNEVLKAYDADNLAGPLSKLTGKGQVIGILIDTLPKDSDLQDFWTRNSLPTTLAQVKGINVQNGQLPDREGEETMDAQWTSGIAPGATVRIYASGSLSFVDLNLALDQIIADAASDQGFRQVSISLGLGEKFISKGIVDTQHSKYLALAALGVNCFVSSGDAGSNPDQTGHGTGSFKNAEYGATDDCVVGVGGTKLLLKPNGQVAQETGWVGSGGGVSLYFDPPPWQKGLPYKKRAVPDVSLLAAPDTGALVIFDGIDNTIGGTSLSAPVWAGFCALINEARAQAGSPALGFVNPSLYKLSGTPAFRDITAGNNGAFKAGPNHDLVTGLGVPVMSVLTKKLSE